MHLIPMDRVDRMDRLNRYSNIVRMDFFRNQHVDISNSKTDWWSVIMFVCVVITSISQSYVRNDTSTHIACLWDVIWARFNVCKRIFFKLIIDNWWITEFITFYSFMYERIARFLNNFGHFKVSDYNRCPASNDGFWTGKSENMRPHISNKV